MRFKNPIKHCDSNHLKRSGFPLPSLTLFLLSISLLFSSNVFGQYDSLISLSPEHRPRILSELVIKRPSGTDSVESVMMFEKLISQARREGEKSIELEIQLYKLRQEEEFAQANYQELKNLYLELVDRLSSGNNKVILAAGQFFTAQLLWNRLQDYNTSMLYFEKAYQNARSVSDSLYLKQQIIYQIGEKYYYLNDYDTAIDFFHEANEVTNPYDPHHPFISINNTLGLAYRVQGKLSKSKSCFERGLFHAEKAQAKVWVGILNGNLGHVYLLQGDTAKGITLLQKDKEISLERGAKKSASGALIELSRLNAHKGQTSLAEAQLDSSLNLINGKLPFHRRKAYYSVKSAIFRNKADWKNAALYIDSALFIRDSLIKKEDALRLVRINQRLELEETKSAIKQAEEKQRRQRQQIQMMVGVLLLLMTGGALLYRQKRKTDRARKRSDKLLLNILPESVAEELKQYGSAQAQRFDQVTVVFTDFKDFTLHSEKLAPKELVAVLNDYFKAFDEISTNCGMEKIKTVGDAYLCACGLPEPNEEHALRAVQCALNMQKFMDSCSHGWRLRVGIHSGPVVAGIVGVKKFAYDIWGDTVNTAARMEQNCEPGRVNLSKATCDLVKDHYHCVHRGKILAKNKGEVDMYYASEKNTSH